MEIPVFSHLSRDTVEEARTALLRAVATARRNAGLVDIVWSLFFLAAACVYAAAGGEGARTWLMLGAAYEFAGTALEELPIPNLASLRLERATCRLLDLGHQRARWLDGTSFREVLTSRQLREKELRHVLFAGWSAYDEATARSVYLQEEIDWAVYDAFGLLPQPSGADFSNERVCPPGTRPFEHAKGYDAGVSDRVKRERL